MKRIEYQPGEYRVISSVSGIILSVRYDAIISMECEYKLINAIDHELNTYKNAWIELAYFQGNQKKCNPNYYENNPVTGEPCRIELIDGKRPVYYPIKCQLEILAEAVVAQATYNQSEEILLEKGLRMLKSGRSPYEVVSGGINIALWRHIIAIELWNKRRNNIKASIGMFSVVMLALKEIKVDHHRNQGDRSRRGRNWQPLIDVMETAIHMQLCVGLILWK